MVHFECLKIFYYENEFFAKPKSCDSSVLLKFTEQMRSLGLETNSTEPNTDHVYCWFHHEGYNWSNLLELLHLVHQGRIPPRRHTAAERWTMGVRGTEVLLIYSMLDTAHCFSANSWLEVKTLLEQQRVLLGSCDIRWMSD